MLLLSCVDDVDELWLERRSTDEKTIDIRLTSELSTVLSSHRA